MRCLRNFFRQNLGTLEKNTLIERLEHCFKANLPEVREDLALGCSETAITAFESQVGRALNDLSDGFPCHFFISRSESTDPYINITLQSSGCRSRRTRALVTSDANGWSSRMQTGGQISAITQTARPLRQRLYCSRSPSVFLARSTRSGRRFM